MIGQNQIAMLGDPTDQPGTTGAAGAALAGAGNVMTCGAQNFENTLTGRYSVRLSIPKPHLERSPGWCGMRRFAVGEILEVHKSR